MPARSPPSAARWNLFSTRPLQARCIACWIGTFTLEAVAHYLPSPLDVPPVEGIDPNNKDKKITRKPDPQEPFCGLVFKVVASRHADLYYVRVYSGRLKANSRVYNPEKDKKEKQIVETINGQRSLADLIPYRSLKQPDRWSSFFQKLWWYDQVTYDLTGD